MSLRFDISTIVEMSSSSHIDAIDSKMALICNDHGFALRSADPAALSSAMSQNRKA
jgi:hypothetical protein